jgi:hypothetical protein
MIRSVGRRIPDGKVESMASVVITNVQLTTNDQEDWRENIKSRLDTRVGLPITFHIN